MKTGLWKIKTLRAFVFGALIRDADGREIPADRRIEFPDKTAKNVSMANPSYIVRRFPEGIFSTFPAATRFGNPADAEAFLRKSFSEELVESVDLRRDFGPARFFHKKESPVSAWNQCAMIIFDPIGGQLI